jgi:hypothetical protein
MALRARGLAARAKSAIAKLALGGRGAEKSRHPVAFAPEATMPCGS